MKGLETAGVMRRIREDAVRIRSFDFNHLISCVFA